MSRPPLPPFTAETAAQKARLAEDAWNTRDPARVALAYTADSIWRNRAEFIHGREAIEAFLTRKWNRELDYRLIKEVWTFRENRIAVRFAYEWRDDSGSWFRSYGNENWEFDAEGLMRRRIASINDYRSKTVTANITGHSVAVLMITHHSAISTFRRRPTDPKRTNVINGRQGLFQERG
jgi:nuclear transport factor 2 (NTF2) superfamily protein